jgi:xylan 1,4-beta-xylosidase
MSRRPFSQPYSHDGGHSWQLHAIRTEVSGLHQNVFGGFLGMKVGTYAAGRGEVAISDFRYRALAESAKNRI